MGQKNIHLTSALKIKKPLDFITLCCVIRSTLKRGYDTKEINHFQVTIPIIFFLWEMQLRNVYSCECEWHHGGLKKPQKERHSRDKGNPLSELPMWKIWKNYWVKCEGKTHSFSFLPSVRSPAAASQDVSGLSGMDWLAESCAWERYKTVFELPECNGQLRPLDGLLQHRTWNLSPRRTKLESRHSME